MQLYTIFLRGFVLSCFLIIGHEVNKNCYKFYICVVFVFCVQWVHSRPFCNGISRTTPVTSRLIMVSKWQKKAQKTTR